MIEEFNDNIGDTSNRGGDSSLRIPGRESMASRVVGNIENLDLD